jgi:hypothetical protein
MSPEQYQSLHQYLLAHWNESQQPFITSNRALKMMEDFPSAATVEESHVCHIYRGIVEENGYTYIADRNVLSEELTTQLASILQSAINQGLVTGPIDGSYEVHMHTMDWEAASFMCMRLAQENRAFCATSMALKRLWTTWVEQPSCRRLTSILKGQTFQLLRGKQP